MIVRMILGILIALFCYFGLGPVGGIVFMGLLFGLLLHLSHGNREMAADLKRIKDKLGIEPEPEKEDVDPEQYVDPDDSVGQRNATNLEIEEELERMHREEQSGELPKK